MVYKINILLLVIILLTFFHCIDNRNFVEKSFSSEDIFLKVKLKDQNSDNKFFHADLTVKNVSTDTIRFTNAGILAISLGDTARAYKDDISSWIGDFSSVNIPEKDSLKFGIYFIFNKILSKSEINDMNIIYRHPSSPIFK